MGRKMNEYFGVMEGRLTMALLRIGGVSEEADCVRQDITQWWIDSCLEGAANVEYDHKSTEAWDKITKIAGRVLRDVEAGVYREAMEAGKTFE